MPTKFPQTISYFVLHSENDFDVLWNDKNCSPHDRNKLKSIFKLISFPITIFVELEYVDKVYRDSYYTFFSNKHIEFQRNCKRFSIFKGEIAAELLSDFSTENESFLKENFAGTIVLRPLPGFYIGRTLLDFKKLAIGKSYLRTTSFNSIVYGHEFIIDAYPFSSQDAETMTCAETSVWSILEYYGTRYPEYKTVLPSDMVRKLKDMVFERHLPSRGLTYQAVTALLKTFGFSPRLYARQAFENLSSLDNYRRIFHYYIESGIPVAVGITRTIPKQKESDIELEEKHSIVAIGHTADKKETQSLTPENLEDLFVINTADLYSKYIVMDDNQIPYMPEEYDHFSIYKNGKVSFFSVPLYKRIFLEAQSAESIIYSLIKTNGFREKIRDNLLINEDNPLVLRIFLTSSRKFKRIRSTNATSPEECAFYQQLTYPKFLWVAELSTQDSYNKGNVLGEIVLDATADRNSNTNSIILIRLLNKFSYRLPTFSVQDIDIYDTFGSATANQPYKMYKNNLIEGGL